MSKTGNETDNEFDPEKYTEPPKQFQGFVKMPNTYDWSKLKNYLKKSSYHRINELMNDELKEFLAIKSRDDPKDKQMCYTTALLFFLDKTEFESLVFRMVEEDKAKLHASGRLNYDELEKFFPDKYKETSFFEPFITIETFHRYLKNFAFKDERGNASGIYQTILYVFYEHIVGKDIVRVFHVVSLFLNIKETAEGIVIENMLIFDPQQYSDKKLAGNKKYGRIIQDNDVFTWIKRMKRIKFSLTKVPIVRKDEDMRDIGLVIESNIDPDSDTSPSREPRRARSASRGRSRGRSHRRNINRSPDRRNRNRGRSHIRRNRNRGRSPIYRSRSRNRKGGFIAPTKKYKTKKYKTKKYKTKKYKTKKYKTKKYKTKKYKTKKYKNKCLI